MPDSDRDLQVAHLLNEVGATVAPHLAPPGVDTVYATVRQRRRNRAVAAGVLALALLGGPSVGFALAGDGDGTAPVGGDPSTSAPTESPSTGPRPSATPSRPAAPDGRISLADLRKAKLDLPPWNKHFSPCKADEGEIVGQPAYSDVDHDGAQETAAVLKCRSNGQIAVYKVVVFDRDAAGKIVTLGQVLDAPTAGGEEGIDIWRLWTVQAAPGGQLRVDVGDYQPCCGMASDLSQHQWRTYGWDGGRFTQTGGSTTFGPNPSITDLRVTAGDLLMTKQADGTWRGRVTATIRNAGPFPAHVEVIVSGGRLTARGDGWTGWNVETYLGGDFHADRMIGELAAGASRKLTFDLSSTTPPTGALSIAANHLMANDPEERGYPDKKQADNTTEATIRAA